MRFLDAAALHDHLAYPAIVAALRTILTQAAQGLTVAPQRMVMHLPADGRLLLMPASDDGIAITKFVTVHPANAARGLPSVHADVLVLNARTGERLLLLDGEIITGRRTAALSVLAAQTLAPDNDGPLLLIGAGTQARAHLEAFVAATNVREVYITARTLAHAEQLAERGRQLGIHATAIANGAAMCAQARLIVTATTSSEPVLPTAVRPDAFIAAVGAFRADMAEIPPELVQRCHLVVDTFDGAQAEAGDLLRANVDWQQVQPLQAVLDLPPPCGRPVLFKSVGHALWDLAAVRVVLASLAEPR